MRGSTRASFYRGKHSTITGRGYQPRRIDLGIWKVPALVFGLGFITISFFVPAQVLFWASTQPFYAMPSAERMTKFLSRPPKGSAQVPGNATPMKPV